uniref:Uncharacterized protein n=1 Tax=Thermosphaera aggregans TaxID=54254 RepID=A0A7C2BLK9_9CREN
MSLKDLTYEYVDFEIASEGWNLYEVEDGTKLRVRVILKTVIKFGMGKYQFGVEQIIGTAFVPERLRGPPSARKYSPEELSQNIEKEDLAFKTLKETWNVYRLSDGGTLSVKAEVSQINKTKLFNEIGEPIYTLNIFPVFKLTTKRK